MAKSWKKEEITYLKRYGAKRRVAELAERFRTDADAVRAKLDEMQLEAADHRPLASDPDPAIELLDKGVKALYAKKYSQAEKLLAQAAAGARQSVLANLARRYQAAARSQLAAAKSVRHRCVRLVAAQRRRGRQREVRALYSHLRRHVGRVHGCGEPQRIRHLERGAFHECGGQQLGRAAHNT